MTWNNGLHLGIDKNKKASKRCTMHAILGDIVHLFRIKGVYIY